MSVVTDYIKISFCVDVSNINISTFRQKIFVHVSVKKKKHTHNRYFGCARSKQRPQCCNESVKVSKRSIKEVGVYTPHREYDSFSLHESA